MTQQGFLSTIDDHAFLKSLDETLLLDLASGAEPFSVRPGEFLAREGQTANRFYVIQSGHVGIGTFRADSSELVLIQTAGPGEVVGWSWLVFPYRWHFECWAMDKVEGIYFDAEWLRARCELDTDLGFALTKHLLGTLAHRLEAARFRLLKEECPLPRYSSDRPRPYSKN